MCSHERERVVGHPLARARGYDELLTALHAFSQGRTGPEFFVGIFFAICTVLLDVERIDPDFPTIRESAG